MRSEPTNPLCAEERKYVAVTGINRARIRGLARQLNRVDPVLNPTRYAQLLAELNAAKADPGPLAAKPPPRTVTP